MVTLVALEGLRALQQYPLLAWAPRVEQMTTTTGEPKRDFRVRLLPLDAVAERGDAVRLDVAELHMEVQRCVPGEVTPGDAARAAAR